MEVDLLSYPKELRELHNYYPLDQYKLDILREMLSNYQLKNADDFNISTANIKKLVPNFFSKERYKFHHKNFI